MQFDAAKEEENEEFQELISKFWSLHNTERLNGLNEDFFYLCEDYTKRHKKKAQRWRLKRLQEGGGQAQNENVTRERTLKDRVRDVMEEPTSSSKAKAFHAFVFILIVAATVTLCLETLPRWDPEVFPKYKSLWFGLEWFFTVVFTLELLIRFLVSVSKRSFFRNFLNVVDLVSILPFYIQLAFSLDSSLRVVRLIRLCRIFRVLKMTRSTGTSGVVIKRVLKLSAPALVIPAFFLLLGLIIVSAVMYFLERGEWSDEHKMYLVQDADCESRPRHLIGLMDCPKVESRFISVPDTLWWAIVTMTTVGYGDVVPITRWGKFIAAITMFCGIIFLAMPLTIVGSNFGTVINEVYEERRARKNELEEQKQDKERDELAVAARLAQLNVATIEKSLDDHSLGLRAVLPALQVCNPKLHRHVDHFLELMRDIRSAQSNDATERNLQQHAAEGLGKEY